jgi:hypothetical protein
MAFKKLATVICITFFAATIIGKYFDYRYRKRWGNSFFEKIGEAFSHKQNYDILLLGNSKIHSGINPYYIDSVTKLNSYNLGVGGADEQEIKLLSTVYLQNHPAPKFVLIGVDNSLLVKHNTLKERFAYLFFLHNDTIKNFMQKNGFPVSLIQLLPFTKYSFFDEYNRTSLFINHNKPLTSHDSYYKGFVNISNDLNSDSLNVYPAINSKGMADSSSGKQINNDTAMAVFRQTIEMFVLKGSQLILIFPPERGKSSLSYNPFFLTLAAQYEIPILRADSVFSFPKSYFVDKSHLNKAGSKIFSLQVADFIKTLR